MKNKIKAIIFDAGGVLALPKENLKMCHHKLHNLGVHEYVAKKLKISLDQYFDSIDTTYAKSIEGKIPKKEVVKILSKNLKTTKKNLEKLYKKAYSKNFKQNKQLFKQAKKLKKLNYKIAVLSDQWHLSFENLMPKKLYSNFDKVIVSCFSKMRKPNPKIYKLILKKLNLKSSECLFIDNQEWNIKPAKKLKIKTILYKDNKQLFREKFWKELFESIKIDKHALKKFVKPLYSEKDKMHNFNHILRIQKKANFLKKDYKNLDNSLLLFLIYFHGLKKWVKKNKNKVLDLGFNELHVKSLTRKNDFPTKPEEKIVCDANILENVGKFGIKKAKVLAKEFNQSQKETLNLAKKFQKKYKFYTRTGKELGKRGLEIKQNWIKQMEKNLR